MARVRHSKRCFVLVLSRADERITISTVLPRLTQQWPQKGYRPIDPCCHWRLRLELCQPTYSMAKVTLQRQAGPVSLLSFGICHIIFFSPHVLVLALMFCFVFVCGHVRVYLPL